MSVPGNEKTPISKKHISFSELKNWEKCPFYHKLIYLDGIPAFKGNEHTAFGSALHEVCEKTVLKQTDDQVRTFLESFKHHLKELVDVDLNMSLIKEMQQQGMALAPLAVPALQEHFGEHTCVSVEEKLYEVMSECQAADFNFKGFIDLVVQTSDGKYHIIDWKTCSWGWDRRRRSDKMVTYQLTLYKHFWAQKHNIPLDKIETHFALLKRTAKKNKVEIFRVTSGNKKTQNALKLLTKAVYNITNRNFIKNRTSCHTKFGPCEFYDTPYCT